MGKTRRQGLRRRGLAGAVLLMLAAWGCEGAHLFAPVTIGPEIAVLSAPASVEAGDALAVAVRALGLVRVDSIVATVRVGSFEETQVARQLGLQSDFSAPFQFQIPAVLSDTLGTVEAFAVDAQHNVGALAAVTVRTIDTAPPTVVLALENLQIGVGTQIEVTITAADNIGLSEIGFRIVDLSGEVIAEALLPESGTQVTRSILYTVPMSLPLGQAQFVGVAIDHEGLTALGLPALVALTDVELPAVQVLTPGGGEFAPAQEALFTRVRINDNDAVDSVTVDAVAHRGDRTLGTDTIVVRFNPVTVVFDPAIADTILQRFLPPAADSSQENTFVRAVAYDRHGNMTRDSVEITLQVDNTPPYVEIRQPLEGSVMGIGDSLLVRSFFREIAGAIQSGVTSLRLEGLAFRGDEELGTAHTVERFQTRTLTFDPPITPTTHPNGLQISRFLTATADATSEPVHIIATATDAWGNARTDTVQIRVVHDTIPPVITIETPLPGTPVVAGTPITIRATVNEPSGPDQSGIFRISFDGVSYRFDPGLGGFQQFPKYLAQNFELPPTPTVLLFTQQTILAPAPDLTTETVWLRVVVQDQIGNTSIDSVNVVLTP